MMHPIDRVLQDADDGGGYYSARKLLASGAYGCPLWFIFGGRRIGKTDMMLQVACQLWIQEGRRTMWLRSLKTEFSPEFVGDFLNDAIDRGWCPEDWYAGMDGVHDSEGKLCIKFQALNTFSNRRGPAHPDVDLMILDEACPEDVRKYPPHPMTALLSLSKTVFAGREGCRIIALSNIVSAANPWFAALRVLPEKAISVWMDKGVAVEICEGYKCSIAPDSPWNRLYKAANYGDYASDSEDPMKRLIVKKNVKGTPERWALLTPNGLYRITTDEKGRKIWDECPRNFSGAIYCSDPTKLEASIIPSLLAMSIRDDFNNQRLRFTSVNAMWDVCEAVIF